ncbi:MAG TPA: Nramp family divalent metal transporter [Methanoculleus sp.]|nr:Nramp family divalent metal transporter [Methanoculleus sp.]
MFLKTVLSIEIGRYAVVTGGSLLQGIKNLPGPANWGIWVIVLPQILVAVATITGMAGAASSAIILALPGSFTVWAVVVLLISLALVFFGKYQGVERVSIVMALAIIVALVTTAGFIFPGIVPLATGLMPTLPPDVEFAELLPWLGFVMSGAAGLVWYSYWLTARGYGAAYYTVHLQGGEERVIEEEGLPEIAHPSRGEKNYMRGWLRLMAISTTIAAGIILILLVALLILGTELLRPEGLLPEGSEVTAVLSVLLGEVWGPPGAWLMILAAFFAFWSTLVANLDGWTRMLGQGSIFIARQMKATGRWVSMRFYRYVYLLGLMGILPLVFVLVRLEPVTALAIAGIIEAIQIPVVAFMTIYLNRRALPTEFRPSLGVAILTFAVGVFFAAFSAYYIYIEFLGQA